jgi:hypothetical protein
MSWCETRWGTARVCVSMMGAHIHVPLFYTLPASTCVLLVMFSRFDRWSLCEEVSIIYVCDLGGLNPVMTTWSTNQSYLIPFVPLNLVPFHGLRSPCIFNICTAMVLDWVGRIMDRPAVGRHLRLARRIISTFCLLNTDLCIFYRWRRFKV